MIRRSLDTETTGVDLRHGARPFLVTICNDGEEPHFWEWPVDPLTREVLAPKEDLEEIQEEIDTADELILQNSSFDAKALTFMGIKWPWDKVYDSLTAGHIVASNHRHDLTSMVLEHLGEDMEHFEISLNKACNKARGIARKQFPDWEIAKEGLPSMPSAKTDSKKAKKGEESEKPWKFDCWLPKAIWQEGKAPDDSWETVTSEYANGDSFFTLKLWKALRKILEQRKLWKIYKASFEVVPVKYAMEMRGVTLSRTRLVEIKNKYATANIRAKQDLLDIAKGYGYDLKLPKAAAPNNSLRTFCFDVLKLEKIRNPKAKTLAPTLDAKNAIEHYMRTLDPASNQYKFISTLKDTRSRDTALTAIEGYRRFWIPLGIRNAKGEQLWYCLYPSLNPTGTDTLRWSSSNPNEQNISKKENFNLRYCFGPAPGREWWSLDAKNIELRIPGYKSGEQALIDLFERSDDPPFYGSEHLLNFSVVYPDIWEGELGTVCKDCCGGKVVDITRIGPHVKKKFAGSWYQRCKNGDFAVGYGAIDKADGTGTADRTFGRPGSHAKLKARFAKKEKLNRECINYANKHGYIETMPDASVDPDRGYPLLCTRTDYGRILETVPLNYWSQGTACWWMRRAMVRTHNYLEQLNAAEKMLKALVRRAVWKMESLGYHLIMQIHDELVFDFPKGEGKEPWKTNLPVIHEIKRLMEQGGKDIGIPTPVSCEYHAVSYDVGMSV